MSHQGDEVNQGSLLKERRFLPFFLTQFLGAFNDNVFKNALIIMIAFSAVGMSNSETNTLTNISAGLFILPFFLFSATAGQWIDKSDKSASIRTIQFIEIIIMLCAAYAFMNDMIYFLIGLLFLMGTQSSFFGPAKYSYIPEHLEDRELIAGNALVQSGTFIAILTGTMVGGVLIAVENGKMIISFVLVGIAILGYLASRGIPQTPSHVPDLKVNWNVFTETWRNIKFIKSNRVVFLSVLGVSWFWFLGATYLVQLPNYTRLSLGGNEQVVTLFLTIFTLGIGSGSLLCNWLSASKVELGLVPFGSIGLTLFGIDMFFAQPTVSVAELVGAAEFLTHANSYRLLTDLFFIGLFGGLYIVPLFALIQQRSAPEHLSRVIAGNNIINALLMVMSAVVAIVLLNAGATIPQLFLVVAILNAVVGIFIYTLVPEFFMRFMVWMLIHSIYHVRKKGLENIPDEGAAVLVCNHVSYVDALILAGCIRRPVRFVMYHKIYNLPILNFVFRTAKTIPIAGVKEDPELMEKAFKEIELALKEGDIVCIFPEGKLTKTGKMNTFRPGVERILKTTPVPVIPAKLDNLWGSVFSLKKSNLILRLVKGIRSSIGLSIAPSIGAEQASAAVLQEKVASL